MICHLNDVNNDLPKTVSLNTYLEANVVSFKEASEVVLILYFIQTNL